MLKKTVLLVAVSLVLALPAFAQETGTAAAARRPGVRWGVIGGGVPARRSRPRPARRPREGRPRRPPRACRATRARPRTSAA